MQNDQKRIEELEAKSNRTPEEETELQKLKDAGKGQAEEAEEPTA